MTFDSPTAMERLLSRHNIQLTDCAGYCLCLAGERTMLINSRTFTLRRGSLYAMSPIVVGEVVEETSDYEELRFVERLEVLFPVFNRLGSIITQLDIPRRPCIELVEAEVEEYLQQETRRRQLQEQLLTTESSLQRTLLEGQAALHMQTVMLDTLRRFAQRFEMASQTLSLIHI